AEPNPDPEPDPTLSAIPFSELHGVNFIDRNLDRNEGGRERPIQTGYVDKFVAKARESGFNVFRVPVRWEGYVDNKDIFLKELDYLVKTANKHDIYVWIVFFQYEATSHWPYKVSPYSGGFPEFVVSCYHPTKDYERDPEIRAFWDDYYLNKVRDSSNSCKQTLDVWNLQARFMEDMINQIDEYPNVIGYELINEPHVWKDSHYDQLGELHTALAKELRKSTDKVLIFTRETAHGFDADGKMYNRKAGLEYKILPKDPANNVMYAPHIYNVKDVEKQVSQWKAVQKKWASMGYDVEIAVGEFAPQAPQIKSPSATQQDIDRFVSVWSREGWMHTYWSYGGFIHGEWNVLVKYNGDLTSIGEYLAKTIIKYYDD
ncbi:MAG: cellulase family glycosylhydrolase, partial [Nitrososphaera sp.]